MDFAERYPSQSAWLFRSFALILLCTLALIAGDLYRTIRSVPAAVMRAAYANAATRGTLAKEVFAFCVNNPVFVRQTFTHDDLVRCLDQSTAFEET